MLMVSAGYDWGYALVESIWGQPNGASQGILAATSLASVILPGVFGAAFAACCTLMDLECKVWVWTPVVLITTVITATFATMTFNCFGMGFDCLMQFALESAFAIVSTITGLRAGSFLYSELKKRIRAPQMLLCSVCAFIPLSVVFVLRDHLPLSVEIPAYFFSITVGATVAAYASKAREREGAIVAAGIGMLPIAIANLLNLSANILFGLAGYLEWRALVSAVALNAVATLAICLGASIARLLSPKTMHRIGHQERD
jgi:hypothetical protein